IDPVGRGYTDEQEQVYGLVFNFTPDRQDRAIAKGVEVLANYRQAEWRAKGEKLVGDKIDVTDLLYRVALEKPFS
ncbi:MAG: hypothetical protein JW863_04720, partial [Chitinispirillaceae bacterium]|nr:hypothetical protein [Chitinispirillaceae bacterium]